MYYVVKRGIAKNAIKHVQQRIACEWTSAGERTGIATGTTHARMAMVRSISSPRHPMLCAKEYIEQLRMRYVLRQQ